MRAQCRAAEVYDAVLLPFCASTYNDSHIRRQPPTVGLRTDGGSSRGRKWGMAMSTLLALLALAASLYLLFQSRPRLFPIIAVSAAGLEVLAAFGVFHPRLGGISLELVCGIALVVAG